MKNIRSYKDQEILFPDGSLLLAGDIGSGKTSLLMAIEYSLFGLQPGQRGSALLRNDSDEGEVALELESGGKSVLIERKLKRSSKGVSNEYASITIDGDKTESSVTEIKTKILDLLGYPSDFIKKNNLLYKYTVYTPQEQMKQIVLEDSETRINVIRHIFGMDKYKRIRENLQIVLNWIKEDSKVLQGEIKNLEEDKVKLQSTKSFIVLLQEKINEKVSILESKVKIRKGIESEFLEMESKIKEKDNLEKEVEKTNILIATKRENSLNLEKEYQELARSLSEIGEEFNQEKHNAIVKRLSEVNTGMDLLNSKNIEIYSQIKSLEQSKNENLEKKERLFKIDICPTCLQDVPEAHKHNILNETESVISNINKKIISLKSENSIFLSLLEKAKAEKAELEEFKMKNEVLKSKIEYIKKSSLKLESIKKLKENFEKDINFLEKHVLALKEKILSFSTLDFLYKKKQEEIKKAFIEEKQAEISLAELKKELEMTQKEVQNLQDFIAEKEKSKKKLNTLLETGDWLSSQFLSLIDFTEKNILMKLRTEFSMLFSNWFHILVSSDSLFVQLDESFSPIIVQNETEMEYSFLSGGERTAVALAYRLALNQTINSALSKIKTKEIVILDEPTDGFSETQIDKMRDVLSELSIEQLIIVSHEQKIESFVDNIIRVKKEGGISVLDSKPSFSSIVDLEPTP